jgi:hypothetical protein
VEGEKDTNKVPKREKGHAPVRRDTAESSPYVVAVGRPPQESKVARPKLAKRLINYRYADLKTIWRRFYSNFRFSDDFHDTR